MEVLQHTLGDRFREFLQEKNFPCVAAKSASEKGTLKIFVADHLACPKDDRAILSFLYEFTEMFRKSTGGFYSAAVMFNSPQNITEEEFERMIWQRLEALHVLDSAKYTHDTRVNADPSSPEYSFSLMEEAFFIIGLHPQSSRPARQFECPVLVFNPHAQFDAMKKDQRYEKMKTIVRKRDLAFSGSVNPMLTDFGDVSEAYQYSGKNYLEDNKCPFILNKK